jgi:hypothetical protein
MCPGISVLLVGKSKAGTGEVEMQQRSKFDKYDRQKGLDAGNRADY